MHNLYRKLESDTHNEKALSCSSPGRALEELLESQGNKGDFRQDAEWGYVFRVKFYGKSFDMSIVPLFDEDFPVAIKRPKGFFDSLQQKQVEEGLFKAKEAVGGTLETLVTVNSLTWYSTDEWRSEFGWSFWNKPVYKMRLTQACRNSG
jgi:hypothetical protein